MNSDLSDQRQSGYPFLAGIYCAPYLTVTKAKRYTQGKKKDSQSVLTFDFDQIKIARNKIDPNTLEISLHKF